MVFVAGFILVLGLFTHDWWVASGQHTAFEELTQEETVTNLFAEQIGQGKAHAHGTQELEGKTGLFGLPLQLGNWVLVGLWIFPMWWYYVKNRKQKKLKI